MRLLIFFLIFPLIFCDDECGVYGANRTDDAHTYHLPANFVLEENRLIGGLVTKPHSWPWTVQLMFNGIHRCGGALIDNNFVLTAAHCFARSRIPSMYKVMLGGHKSGSGIPRNVTDIAIHDLFNIAWPNSYDVAVLRIDPPANITDTVRKICLPALPAPINGICVVAGWGVLSENGRKSQELREIHVPIVPWLECNNLENFRGRVHLPSMICAGYSQGNLDSCQGDSGGPLMCSFNGKWEVQGLVSWGIGCGRPGHPGVYSSVYSVLPWIQYQMWNLKKD
ncbi:unnamed protein product [Auanema sp. JU1783]|nr:unnamed protein product [Auanema sp. JU1783]